jgi:hypothetical protein
MNVNVNVDVDVSHEGGGLAGYRGLGRYLGMGEYGVFWVLVC